MAGEAQQVAPVVQPVVQRAAGRHGARALAEPHLELNGYRVQAPDADLAGWILSFSTGTTPQQLAPLVRDALQALR